MNGTIATRQAMAEEKVPPCRKRFAFFVGTDESLNLSLPDPPDQPTSYLGRKGTISTCVGIAKGTATNLRERCRSNSFLWSISLQATLGM